MSNDCDCGVEWGGRIVYCRKHAAADKMLALLKSLESGDIASECPCCFWIENEESGHFPDCKLETTIADAEPKP